MSSGVVMKTLFALLLAVMLAGCASNRSSSVEDTMADIDSSKGVICTNDVPTGSALREKRCTTAAQRADQRRQEDMLIVQPVKTNGR
jgi:hypothetical protein